jgi:hypothetical protein
LGNLWSCPHIYETGTEFYLQVVQYLMLTPSH